MMQQYWLLAHDSIGNITLEEAEGHECHFKTGPTSVSGNHFFEYFRF